DFASDIRTAVEFLRQDKRIDSKRIGLIGHSEGGLIGPMVAADAPDEIAFVVMLAGPRNPGGEDPFFPGGKNLRAQGASESDAKANREYQAQLFKVLREEPDPAKRRSRLLAEMAANVKKLPGVLRKGVEDENVRKMQAAILDNGWMRFFLTYDPIPTF